MGVTVILGRLGCVMGWELGKLLWKSGVDWVKIRAVEFWEYAEPGDSSQVSND